jgi:S1-C subfamily serine protease
MADSLLFTAVRITAYDATTTSTLSGASGFFFKRDERLYLVTSRHVMTDVSSDHHPTHIQLELHTDGVDLTASVGFDIPLYRDGLSLWRQGSDSGGDIDVAVIELQRGVLPETLHYHAFTPAHLNFDTDEVEIGASLLVVGFPLGFHDALYHMPVVRQAICASAFGLRFQGKGFFLTDARMHRGSSGAPVVMRYRGDSSKAELPWRLLGIHAAKFDVGTREAHLDEALGLNCVWYADILMELTKPA